MFHPVKVINLKGILHLVYTILRFEKKEFYQFILCFDLRFDLTYNLQHEIQ